MSTSWRLTDRDSGAVVVRELELAEGFWSRFWGLQFRSTLPAGRGLLLVDCPSIHTCWMRFAIDVVMLDGRGRVLAVRQGMRPWRALFAARGTECILELPAGSAEVMPGTRVRLDRADGDPAALPGFAARWEDEATR